MSLWSYSGKDLAASNQPVKGKVMADDEKSAKEQVEKMGIKCDAIVALPPVDEMENRVKETVSGAIKGLQDTTRVSMSTLLRPQAPIQTDKRPQPSCATRHQVFFGQGQQVKHESMDILSKGGRVVHALMCPDGSGRPNVLLVVEYSEEQK